MKITHIGQVEGIDIVSESWRARDVYGIRVDISWPVSGWTNSRDRATLTLTAESARQLSIGDPVRLTFEFNDWDGVEDQLDPTIVTGREGGSFEGQPVGRITQRGGAPE